MRASGELARAEDPLHLDNATRRLNQLTRTYTAQLEARKRYLSGEPRVTVHNLSVTEGGQAIVGNVTQGTHSTPPQAPENAEPALSNARQPAAVVSRHSERAPIPHPAKRKA